MTPEGGAAGAAGGYILVFRPRCQNEALATPSSGKLRFLAGGLPLQSSTVSISAFRFIRAASPCGRPASAFVRA